MKSNFSFFPKNLLKQRLIAEKNYYLIQEKVIQTRLPSILTSLLEAIRKIEQEKIVSFSRDLSKFDIRVLMRGYPFSEEVLENRLKINNILITRYQSWIGQQVWDLFQQEHRDFIIHDFLRSAFQLDKGSFLGFSSSDQIIFEQALEHPTGILNGMGEVLIHNKQTMKEMLLKWRIKEASKLESYLINYMFYFGIKNDWMIEREGIPQIKQYFSQISKKNYVDLLRVYLESRNTEQFHTELLIQAVQVLKDPRGKTEEWNFLNELELNRVKSWLVNNDLKKFFGSNNQRFEFWGRYCRYMQKVFKIDSPNIIFLYFDKFVVMEFGDGGAAHFYHKNGFEEFIFPLLNSREFKQTNNVIKRESMIKMTTPKINDTLLFITKLSHTKNWKLIFSKFLDESFDLS